MGPACCITVGSAMWVWGTGGRSITLAWRCNEYPADVSAVIPMMVYLDQITSSHERGRTVDATILQSLLWWGCIEYPIAPYLCYFLFRSYCTRMGQQRTVNRAALCLR